MFTLRLIHHFSGCLHVTLPPAWGASLQNPGGGGSHTYQHPLYGFFPPPNETRFRTERYHVESCWNVMTHGDAREGKWRGNWQMEWVASTLHNTSEHGVSSITTADAHTSAASNRLNWRPRRFKWTRPFRRKTKSDFCACAITFQTQSTAHASRTYSMISRFFTSGVSSVSNVLIYCMVRNTWICKYSLQRRRRITVICLPYFKAIIHDKNCCVQIKRKIQTCTDTTGSPTENRTQTHGKVNGLTFPDTTPYGLPISKFRRDVFGVSRLASWWRTQRLQQVPPENTHASELEINEGSEQSFRKWKNKLETHVINTTSRHQILLSSSASR